MSNKNFSKRWNINTQMDLQGNRDGECCVCKRTIKVQDEQPTVCSICHNQWHNDHENTDFLNAYRATIRDYKYPNTKDRCD